MDKEEDYIIEDIIKGTEELICDKLIDELGSERDTEAGRRLVSEVQRKELASLSLEARPVVDGIVELRVSKDDMEVRADFSFSLTRSSICSIISIICSVWCWSW